MNRNFGIGILILCFGLSSFNASLAAQVIEISPVIVQPYDLREISQQMLEQDRVNRDQELAIRGLIDDNQKFIDTALARQQNATLEKINQTMIHYRDALLFRDRARIAANNQRVSKYYDLITLTENVDDMKGVGQTLQLKSNVIEEKYKILTELKDEMTALNEKIKGETLYKNFEKINQVQEEKIQLLTQKLGGMDQRIARYDEIIARKDQQIARLKENLAADQNEASSKNEAIHWLKQVLDVTKNKAEYYKLTAQRDQIIVRNQAIRLDLQLTQEQAQADTLRRQLADQQNKADLLKQELDSKNAQSDQMTLMMSDYQKKLESKDNAYNEQLGQILTFKNYQTQMEKQIADLNVRLQEKEAQVVKIKKDMYDLQELMSAKDRDLQAKDLNLAIELALAHRQLSQIKATADEYEKEFKDQSREFKRLKEQLQNAYVEIIRLKERSTKSNRSL